MTWTPPPSGPRGRAASAKPDASGWRPYRPSITTRMTKIKYYCTTGECEATTETPGLAGWYWRRLRGSWTGIEMRCPPCHAAGK